MALITWVAMFSAGFFIIMKESGRLRIGETFEIFGMDVIEEYELTLNRNLDCLLTYDKLVQLEIKQRGSQRAYIR